MKNAESPTLVDCSLFVRLCIYFVEFDWVFQTLLLMQLLRGRLVWWWGKGLLNWVPVSHFYENIFAELVWLQMRLFLTRRAGRYFFYLMHFTFNSFEIDCGGQLRNCRRLHLPHCDSGIWILKQSVSVHNNIVLFIFLSVINGKGIIFIFNMKSNDWAWRLNRSPNFLVCKSCTSMSRPEAFPKRTPYSWVELSVPGTPQ